MKLRDLLHATALIMVAIGVIMGFVTAFESPAIGPAVIRGGLTFGAWMLAAVFVGFISDLIGGKKP